MPIHVDSCSRRHFLSTSALLGGGLLTRFSLGAAADGDPESYALLSDTHISADPAKVLRETHLCDNLKAVVAEVKGRPKRAAAVFLSGDAALNDGQPGDYEQLLTQLSPLLGEGAPPLHIGLGNHDDRANFRAIVKPRGPATIESKHVALVEGRDVNWFLVDTLRFTNKVEGELGEEQRQWLNAALKAHADKPAIVVGHHNPQFPPAAQAENAEATQVKHTGIVDTELFVSLLESHRHVKAYIYGHTHNWSHQRRESGLHFINLPPVAYVFDKARPNGWVEVTTTPGKAVFKLHALSKTHPEEGATVELALGPTS
ncbi:3',5'-cyclic AMP phosphodiesterase CpdA [Roseimicrobium gellanilyticum]|uniref:3',5'-cyclic AMP phosphodiesterase CpdA n=1 Tax=Roseimicrobium gellanilyticum TaxID=748857 RepID=A0A366HNI5_9BACT|nr:metallophosphoesterase [Roseimicrobium gellanilyticum]RBP45056.1 3',5'-cyclic AMP phosphodiesterase CpdA [Roseimicrobium gellanilyticum]